MVDELGEASGCQAGKQLSVFILCIILVLTCRDEVALPGGPLGTEYVFPQLSGTVPVMNFMSEPVPRKGTGSFHVCRRGQ